ASKTVPHARQRYWSVMAWVPNSEMTSASRALQWGQAGSVSRPSGLLFGRGGRKPLLLQTPQHAEGEVVDGAGPGSPPDRIPSLPVQLDGGRLRLHSFLEPCFPLSWAHAALAFLAKARGGAVG